MTAQSLADDFKPLVVGRLAGSYGVKGWAKVYSFTEPMENLLEYRQLYLQRAGRWQPVAVEDGRPHGKGLIIKLEGVESPEAARALSNCELAVEQGALPELEEGEFYWYQLVGLQVVIERAGEAPLLIGVVDHLLETGANDVLVVKPCEGSIDQRERLLPYLPGDVVRQVDLDNGVLTVDWDAEF
ncbi:MAG: ribosome maturation factor RimM [Spongiibacteraceae bacterium]|jgi:16S rRNA processing protein RimM|nr:ribosome maturation factor RimM [Spongiibacteraceae bacterium]